MIVKQYTLNRKTYKDVKKMDHQQMTSSVRIYTRQAMQTE